MATQRQSPRHRVVHVLKVFDDETGVRLGHVGDVSPEGLLLAGTKEIERGTRKQLCIEIPLENGETDELLLDAESRWSGLDTETGAWLTGFNIEASPLNSRMLLASLIHDDI